MPDSKSVVWKVLYIYICLLCGVHYCMQYIVLYIYTAQSYNRGFIKDEYCSWVQYKSGPGGGPLM